MQVVETTAAHIEQFLTLPIREADADEWFIASGGVPVSQALRSGWQGPSTVYCRSLLDDSGVCVCVWGITRDPKGTHMVWLIASQQAERMARAIHRLWRKELKRMHEHSETLVAIAYANNSLHLHWLQVIGFRLIAQDVVGVGRYPFNTYVKEA